MLLASDHVLCQAVDCVCHAVMEGRMLVACKAAEARLQFLAGAKP